MEPSPAVAQLSQSIRDVPDFPKPGIVFKDITTLLRDPRLLHLALDEMAGLVQSAALHVDRVVAIESRGFILGAALADRLGAGFVPIRKPGKLPWRTVAASYTLEYGTDSIEMHADGLDATDEVLIVDDLIATGGTAAAAGELVARLGARVAAYLFLIELTFLSGRDKLAESPVLSLIRF
jgi:adenine phosphoribosyltransferase